jgi:squalene-hopene/tetraprenyl-beta-curcumene cyclase
VDAIVADPLKSAAGEPSLAAVEETIAQAAKALGERQHTDGYWHYPLEADATIPSEYILLEHYLDEIDAPLEADLAAYIRAQQGSHGGWPLFHQGDFDMSASVKAYFALKLVGDSPDAPHMARAREAILARGGAAKSNVFTRYALALWGEVPWRAAPVMPVELLLMPRWFPVTLWRVSYWSRTVIVPLLVMAALKPRARNPRGARIQELFCTPPGEVKTWQRNPTGKRMGELFLGLDSLLRVVEPYFPKRFRKRAIERAVAFIEPRQYGEDGLGGIFPAMANAVMAFDALGYARDHPSRAAAMASVKKLLLKEPASDGLRFCQSCLSPVWDTGLAGHAMLEAGLAPGDARIAKACRWLAERQILDVEGDWAAQRPGLRPGGWAFQYRNDHYPDVDDTAVVGLLLHRADAARHEEAIKRAAEWIIGMQSKNGGWGAFDADNSHYYLNNIPFADHGALLDPPTADVSARCLSFLGQLGYSREHPAVRRGLDYLLVEQEEDGSWFGRWGTNYVYGTWSVLCAFNALGEDPRAPYMRRAIDFLLSRQRSDGGWGEDGATYWQERRAEVKESTPSQTAWALMGLMAAGEIDNPAVKRGIAYLLRAPRKADKWVEPWYTAVGFPRIFYLRYHGYSAYFPLWALARYRNLKRSNAGRPAFGM